MRQRKSKKPEPMPRAVLIFLVALAFILAALVLITGKFYLPNWKGNIIFLPVAIFIGFLLVAAAVARIVRKN